MLYTVFWSQLHGTFLFTGFTFNLTQLEYQNVSMNEMILTSSEVNITFDCMLLGSIPYWYITVNGAEYECNLYECDVPTDIGHQFPSRDSPKVLNIVGVTSDAINNNMYSCCHLQLTEELIMMNISPFCANVTLTAGNEHTA